MQCKLRMVFDRLNTRMVLPVAYPYSSVPPNHPLKLIKLLSIWKGGGDTLPSHRTVHESRTVAIQESRTKCYKGVTHQHHKQHRFAIHGSCIGLFDIAHEHILHSESEQHTGVTNIFANSAITHTQ